MKEIFKWWITQTNIDGFRIDTMKHVELAFWEDFCNEIREWAASAEGGGKEFFMMAEVYSANVSFLNDFTVNNMADSLLGFQMAGSVFDWNDGDNITVFKDSGIFSSRPKTQTLADIHAAVSADTGLGSLSIHTGGDGLTARQKAAYFIDNHDLNRFLNSTSGVSNESASAAEILNLQNALMWLLTWEGIPVIYYGTEQNYKQSLALTGQGEHGDGAGNCEKGNRPRLWKVKNSSNSNTAFSETHSTFKLISGLSALRKSMPELSRGYAAIKLASNTDTPAGKNAGLFGFIRGYGATADPLDDILVVINTHPSQIGQTKTDDDSQCIAVGGSGWGYPAGTVLEAVDIPGFDDDHDGTSDEADESYLDNQGADLFHYTPDQTSITVFANGSQNECYFKVPPQSVKILKVKQ
jgi:glycosidase